MIDLITSHTIIHAVDICMKFRATVTKTLPNRCLEKVLRDFKELIHKKNNVKIKIIDIELLNALTR